MRSDFSFKIHFGISVHRTVIRTVIRTVMYTNSTRTLLYVCMVITYSRVWINRIRLTMLLAVSWTGKINIPLSSYVPENLVSRHGLFRPASACSLSIVRLNLVLTNGIPPDFRDFLYRL